MRAILFRVLLLTFVAASIGQPAAQQPASQQAGALSIDTLMATPFPTDLFPAQWDPKLGIHVT